MKCNSTNNHVKAEGASLSLHTYDIETGYQAECG